MRKKHIIVAVILLLVIIFAAVFINKNYYLDTSSGKVTIKKKGKYDASNEIKEALNAINSSKRAEVITNVDASSNIVALSFEGINNKDTMQKIVDSLHKHGVKATFFLPGIKAAEDDSVVKIIERDGHDIGNGTLSSKKAMENLTQEELVTDFCSTNKILQDITGKKPALLKCSSTVYNDNILMTAYASGNKYAVASNHYVSYQSFKNYEQAYGYIKNLEKGTIISIKLDGVLDSFEYGENKEEKPAVDKQAGLNEKTDKEEVTIEQTVEWLLKAIDEQHKTVVKVIEIPNVPKENRIPKNQIALKNQSSNNNTDLIDFGQLVKNNNKKLAPVISKVYTTEKSLAYTFRGISNEKSLNSVLEELDTLNAKGTFFVSKDDIIKYPDRINKIISKGHEIGNGGVTANSNLLLKSPEEICKEIYEVDKLLKTKGITTNAYMAGYGYSNAKIQEAISAITAIPSLKNYELFTYSKAPVTLKYKDMKAEDIVTSYFNVKSYVSLQRGEVVYFRLDSGLFKNDDTISNVIDLLTKNYVQNGYAYRYNEKLDSYDLVQKPLGYSIVTLGELQKTFETSSQLGRYNIIKNSTDMEKRTYDEALKMMNTNYIGNEYIDLSNFSEEEKLSMDKTGTIDTKGDNVIFFTFDDWGGDPIVNGILDVLNKHQVKGTFFAIGKNVDINSGISNINPNLLRAIALDGNDIGSHDYNHEPLDTSEKVLDISLPKSYEVMTNIIGDLHALKPYFRPPSLIIEKEGLTQVYESGYKYCINGNITTHDYERPSAEDIANYIAEGLVKGRGNVIVMHMNNEAYYTAEAIDLFLTNNEKGMYGVKYKVAKLSDYLGQ